MPTGEIGHLKAALSANYAAFESDMSKAKEAVRKNAEGMNSAMAKVGKSFEDTIVKVTKFASVAGVAAAGALAMMVAKQLVAADRFDELAQSTGTTTEFLSSMTIALKTSGVEVEQFAKGMERMMRNMQDAGNGIGEAKEAFELLGVEIKNSDGTLRNTEDLFKEFADRFASLPDGAEKTALAMKLFGKAGADLIPVLNMGSAGLAEMQAQAERLGLVIGTKAAKEAAYLTDQFDILKMSGEGLARTVGLAIIPQLNEMIRTFVEASKSGGLLAGALAVVKNIGEELSRRAAILTASKKLEESIKEYDEFRKKPIQLGFVEERIKRDIAERKAALDSLMAEDRKKEKAEQDALNASLERQRREQEARKKNLDSLLKTEEAKKKAEVARKESDEEEKRRQKAIDSQIETLERQADTYGMTSDEVAMYTLEQLGANKAQKEAAQIAIDDIRTKELLAEAERAHQEELNKTAEAAKRLYDETRTPFENLVSRLEMIDDLYAKGAISADTWMRAYAKSFEEIDTESDKVKDDFDELQRAIEGWGKDSAAAIVDFVTGSKGAFTDLIDSIIKDIMRMMVYQNITKPLFDIISLGGGKFFSGLLGSANGNVFSGGNILPFAKGGIVTGPTVFPMATGAGLMGEAGPEAVMPLGRLSSGELGVKASGEGEGATIINITAVDAKSFEDLCKRNPNAIIGPVTKGLKANQQRKQWKGLING